MLPLLRFAADTMLVRQVPPDRSAFEQVVFVAGGLAQVLTLVVVVLLAVIFYRMWRAQLAVQAQLSQLAAKVDPMLASATSAAENVRALTDAVKRDAGAAAEALSEATGRVRDAVGGIADRIDDVGDLLGRVTEKADAVVEVAGAAASTIRAGSRLFRGRVRKHTRPEREPRRERSERHDADLDDDTPPGPDEPRRLAEMEDLEARAHTRDAHPPKRRRRPRRRRPEDGSARDGAPRALSDDDAGDVSDAP